MVDITEVRANLKPGEVVITEATFKKSVTFREPDLCGECWYNGQKWIHEWLLTYGHTQYQLLRPLGGDQAREERRREIASEVRERG